MKLQVTIEINPTTQNPDNCDEIRTDGQMKRMMDR